MTQGYSLFCWCLAIVLIRVDDAQEKLPSPPKMKVVIVCVKICMMLDIWLQEFNS